jgi:hypothetical protein
MARRRECLGTIRAAPNTECPHCHAMLIPRVHETRFTAVVLPACKQDFVYKAKGGPSQPGIRRQFDLKRWDIPFKPYYPGHKCPCLFRPVAFEKRVSPFSIPTGYLNLSLMGSEHWPESAWPSSLGLPQRFIPFSLFTDLANDIATARQDRRTVLDGEIV